MPHYAILTKNEPLGVLEYPDEEALKDYLSLFSKKPIYFSEVAEEDVWRIRKQIKKGLEKYVRRIQEKLWGHIGKRTYEIFDTRNGESRGVYEFNDEETFMNFICVFPDEKHLDYRDVPNEDAVKAIEEANVGKMKERVEEILKQLHWDK